MGRSHIILNRLPVESKMKHTLIEIKAKCRHPGRIREILRQSGADFKGTDEQTDTYFKCTKGRLKLRQGLIENNLIFYKRPNQPGPKQSDVQLFPVKEQSDNLKNILFETMGVLKTVSKKREIYFIDNVKFHIDTIANLGSFMEIEAIGIAGETPVDLLRSQCRHYLELFDIREDDLITHSYSDMIP